MQTLDKLFQHWIRVIIGRETRDARHDQWHKTLRPWDAARHHSISFSAKSSPSIPLQRHVLRPIHVNGPPLAWAMKLARRPIADWIPQEYLLNQISNSLFRLTLSSHLPTMARGTWTWPFPVWEFASDDIFVEKRDLGNHIDSAEAQHKGQYGHNRNWEKRMNEKMWQPNPF